MSFADKLVPVLVIMLFLYMHYAYAVELCLLKITSIVKKIVYLVGIHVCVLPVVIHYFVTMFMGSGTVPSSYRFGLVEMEALNRLDPSDTKIDRILEQFCYYRGIQTYTRKYNRIRYTIRTSKSLLWFFYLLVQSPIAGIVWNVNTSNRIGRIIVRPVKCASWRWTTTVLGSIIASISAITKCSSCC